MGEELVVELTAESAAAVEPNGAPSPGPQDPKQYSVSIDPVPTEPLPDRLGQNLARLGESLGMPVWVLLQDGNPEHPLSDLNAFVEHMFRREKAALTPGQPIALVINSPGGDARAAYGLARMICRRSGGFVAVVPDAAMSAATLLAIGATRILMGDDANLGPLDAQIFDHEAEIYGSVLNEVQALERLRAYALESFDATMRLLLQRTGKRIDSLLPHVLKFVADSMAPLLDKIDVVHYNERARILKVGEEYAVRLLRPKHPEPTEGGLDQARMIASALVENYPEHGFRIDREEAKKLGLAVVTDLPPEQSGLLEELWSDVQGVQAIGKLEEVAAP